MNTPLNIAINTLKKEDQRLADKVATNIAIEKSRLVNEIPTAITEMRNQVDYYREKKREITATAKTLIDDEVARQREVQDNNERKIDAIKNDHKLDRHQTYAKIDRMKAILQQKSDELISALDKRQVGREEECHALANRSVMELDLCNTAVEEYNAKKLEDLAAADSFIDAAEVFFSNFSKDVTPQLVTEGKPSDE